MNITKLNNISSFEVNNSIINNTNEIIPSLITNANTQTDGYLGLGIQITLFIVLLIILMSEQDVFRFNFTQALAGASGITLLVGIILFISDISSSFVHLMWFAVIFAIALVLSYYNKN